MKTSSFYQPVPTREHIWLREAAFKARRMEGRGVRCISGISPFVDIVVIVILLEELLYVDVVLYY